MSSRVTIRRLASKIHVPEEDVLLWLMDKGHPMQHPADHLPVELADAAATALTGRSVHFTGATSLADHLKRRGLHKTEVRQRVRDVLVDDLGGNPDTFAVEELVPLIDEFLAVWCGNPECEVELRRNPRVRLVLPGDDATRCDFCAGKDNQRAVRRMLRLCEQHRPPIAKMLVVGGSPDTHTELRALVGDRLALHIIEGDVARTRAQADNDVAWADLVVVWGATILSHKVSELYTDRHSVRETQCVLIRRRGIAALAEEVIAHLLRR